MTLRNLTPKQLEEFQKQCLHNLKQLKLQSGWEKRTIDEIYQMAFTKGVLAGLNFKPE